MAVALFLMELNIPVPLVADYADTMNELGIDIDSFATFDDDKVEAMAKALKTAKVRAAWARLQDPARGAEAPRGAVDGAAARAISRGGAHSQASRAADAAPR